MAYVKNTWVDQDVERPKTYEVTNNQDGSITLTDSFGLVTELGTPVNEVNMNHIENGIDGCAIRKHNLTETFNLGEWALGGTGDDEGIYKSLIANNVGNAISDDTAWEKVELGGSGYEVGDIIIRNTPTNDAGKHLLDGALIQYGSYQAFVDYIAGLVTDYPDLFVTESDWQQSVNTYGVCGKFVYDSVNNTVRLPKITGFIEGTTDITALGDLVEAGLPNVACSNIGADNLQGRGTARPPFYKTGVSAGYNVSLSGAGVSNAVGFDLKRANPIYKNNFNKVQPQTIKVLYYIVIATTTKTDIQVDIDKIATDLNGKADVDLTNVNNPGTSRGAGWAMPSSTYVDLTLGASGTQYTAPANGWFWIRKSSNAANQYINMLASVCTQNYAVGNNGSCNLFLPIRKGEKMTCYYSLGGVTEYFRFIYAVGSESEA